MPMRFQHREQAFATAPPSFGKGDPIPGPRNWSQAARDERVAFIEERVGPIPALAGRLQPPDAEFFRGNIENYVGLTAVPTGIVGPLRMRGEHAQGDCYLPLATTEGALVASYNRGAAVTAAAGGIVAAVGGQSVHRAPVFAFSGVSEAIAFAGWVDGEVEHFRQVVLGRTRHGRLADVRIHLEANLVYLIFSFRTGDAAGQNMVTLCAEAICQQIVESTPVQPEFWFLESNLSGDKKATFLSFLNGRGWTATAETVLPEKLVSERLHTTPTRMLKLWETGTVAAVQSGSIGVSGHVANGLAALFLACGQDVACVSEASVGVTRFELTTGGDLRCTITMPNLIVGTVGGGTRMPTARDGLRIAGCTGEGSAPRLAELCAGLSLAGEISISAALCAGNFAAAHAIYGRPKAAPPAADGSAAPAAAPAPAPPTARVRLSEVAHRAAFDRIRYASVWEDADAVCEAIAPTAAGGRVLSIASAGDNALAILTLDPREVVAVDLSAAQLACLELRMAAFTELDHAALLGFLGFAPHPDRGRTYLRLRHRLSRASRAVWDARRQAILTGPALSGRFERYLALFRDWVLPLVHDRQEVARLLEPRTAREREDFYDQVWNNRRWRLLSRLFFSRLAMGHYGRDPAFFAEVGAAVGDVLFARNERFLRSPRVEANPYLTLLLTGGFDGRVLPRYLRPEWHEVIRSRIGRIHLALGSVEEMDGPFDAFNLSDVFEYLRPHEHAAVARRVVEMAAPAARAAYWELFLDRALEGPEHERAVELTDESRRLSDAALTWFYRGLRVWEVRS